MAVTLFSYQKGTSPMHRIPALVKIIFLLIFSIFVCYNKGQASALAFYIKNASCIFIALLIFFIASPSVKTLLALHPVLFLGFLVTLFKTFDFITFTFSKEGLIEGLLYTLRFLLTSLVASVVFKTTSSIQIKDALEQVQNCLAKILPVIKKINPALLLSLTINFIPMIFDTWNKIELAAKARSPKKRFSLFKIRIFYAEFSALFSCLLYKAEITRKALLNRS